MIPAQKRYGRAHWIILAVWLLVALLSYGQNYLFALIREEAFDQQESFSFALMWLSWIPFSYPVIWIVWRHPFARGQVLRSIRYQVPAAVVIMTAHLAFNAWLMSAFWTAFIYPVTFRDMLLKLLTFSVFTDIVIYVLLVVLVHSIEFYKGLQAEKLRRLALERDLSAARLHALQAQLQPHFLFNTHHAIVSLLEAGKPAEATQMILGLSDLLRFSLRKNQNSCIPLEQEIALLELYLNIQQIRFQDRLRVCLHYDQTLASCLVPAMVLQPLAENAIRHALELHSDSGQLKITVERKGLGLQLQVQDDGPAQPPGVVFPFGIGLSNTQARLQQLYGDQYVLQVSSNYPERGVTAILQLPLQLSNKELL